jgi:hypothetical protein
MLNKVILKLVVPLTVVDLPVHFEEVVNSAFILLRLHWS